MTVQALNMHFPSHTVPQFFGALISTAIVCIVLLIMNWKMGLALLWVAPVAFAIVLLSRKWQEKLGKKYMTERMNLSEGIHECLETVQDIKACNQEDTYLKKLDAKMDIAEKHRFQRDGQRKSSYNRSDDLKTWSCNCDRCGKFSNLTWKDQSVYVYSVSDRISRLYDPLSGAMANMAELFGANLQVNRLKEIQEYPLESGQKDYHTKGYDVTFDHVKFSYEEGKPVLKDVSFTAKQGQVTSISSDHPAVVRVPAKLCRKILRPLLEERLHLVALDIANPDSVALKDFRLYL